MENLRKGRGKYPAMESELYEGIMQHARDAGVDLATLVRRADTTLSAKVLSARANRILARVEPGASVSEKWVSHFKKRWGMLSTRLAPAPPAIASSVSGGGSLEQTVGVLKAYELLEQKFGVLEEKVQDYELLEQKFGVLEEKVQVLEERVRDYESLEQKVETLEERVRDYESLEQKLETLEEKVQVVEVLDEKVEVLEQKFTQAEKTMVETQDTAASVRQAVLEMTTLLLPDVQHTAL